MNKFCYKFDNTIPCRAIGSLHCWPVRRSWGLRSAARPTPWPARRWRAPDTNESSLSWLSGIKSGGPIRRLTIDELLVELFGKRSKAKTGVTASLTRRQRSRCRSLPVVAIATSKQRLEPTLISTAQHCLTDGALTTHIATDDWSVISEGCARHRLVSPLAEHLVSICSALGVVKWHPSLTLHWVASYCQWWVQSQPFNVVNDVNESIGRK